MIAVPTVAPSVTNRPQHGSEQHAAGGSQDRTRYEHRAEAGGYDDVGQWRDGTRGGNRAPNVLDVDDPSDRNEIEQPEQERREQGEAHDVVSSGNGGGAFAVGHAGRRFSRTPRMVRRYDG